MLEYRANRKLGLQIRDMVAEGRLEDAKAMAANQVGEVGGGVPTHRVAVSRCVGG